MSELPVPPAAMLGTGPLATPESADVLSLHAAKQQRVRTMPARMARSTLRGSSGRLVTIDHFRCDLEARDCPGHAGLEVDECDATFRMRLGDVRHARVRYEARRAR